jgi:hypothetical protein
VTGRPLSRTGRAALAYAERLGWPVVPLYGLARVGGRLVCTCKRGSACPCPGKHPRLFEWQKHASADPAAVREWWGRWPDSGVGLATGAGAGHVVLDEDTAKGKTGDEERAALERQHGPLPETPRAITGSGGYHHFFDPQGVVVGNRVNLRPGLDIRGDGGQVVAAPTLHVSGALYAWEAGCSPLEVPLAPLPDWLLQLVGTRSDEAAEGLTLAPPDMAGLPPLERRARRARAYVQKMPGAVAGQAGHAATFVVATTLVRGFALPADVALDIISTEFNPRCSPPWEEGDLLHKVQSAYTASNMPWGIRL